MGAYVLPPNNEDWEREMLRRESVSGLAVAVNGDTP